MGNTILLICLTSCLAAGSLKRSINNVLKELKNSNNKSDMIRTRNKLSLIVGRDVDNINKSEILRALAETSSENAVDGIFAPLFWMFVGAFLWSISINLPGPLTLALTFKATSTIDSMIGYKYGTLQWLGTAGARLDDFLTWMPCRLVLISLPFVSQKIKTIPNTIKEAIKDGSKDDSPNSGISQAIFAHCLNIRMGGMNKYKETKVFKPLIAEDCREAEDKDIEKIFSLILRLEFLWILLMSIVTLFII